MMKSKKFSWSQIQDWLWYIVDIQLYIKSLEDRVVDAFEGVSYSRLVVHQSTGRITIGPRQELLFNSMNEGGHCLGRQLLATDRAALEIYSLACRPRVERSWLKLETDSGATAGTVWMAWGSFLFPFYCWLASFNFLTLTFDRETKLLLPGSCSSSCHRVPIHF